MLISLPSVVLISSQLAKGLLGSPRSQNNHRSCTSSFFLFDLSDNSVILNNLVPVIMKLLNRPTDVIENEFR
jgi:hypothetical protein